MTNSVPNYNIVAAWVTPRIALLWSIIPPSLSVVYITNPVVIYVFKGFFMVFTFIYIVVPADIDVEKTFVIRSYYFDVSKLQVRAEFVFEESP